MVETKKLLWMVKKEWISLKRHPSRLVAIIVFPIIMILLFGYGMGGDLENLSIVVVAQDDGALTNNTLDIIKSMDIYHVMDIIDDADDAKKMVDKGEVKAAIILPSNYDSNTNNQKAVTLYIDSSDQMATQTLVPTTEALFNEISAKQSAALTTSYSKVVTENATTNKDMITSSIDNVKSAIALQVNKIYGDINMKCKNCGASLKDNAIRCPNCGAFQDEEEGYVLLASNEHVDDSYYEEMEAEQKRKNRKKKKCYFLRNS